MGIPFGRKKMAATPLSPTSREEPIGVELPEQLSSRITEFEIKLSYSEDQLDALNRTVYLQQQQIDLLLREFRVLREQMTSNAPGETLSLRDELPPHY